MDRPLDPAADDASARTETDPLTGATPFRWDQFGHEEEAVGTRSRRGRLLLAAGTVPWVVLASLLLRSGTPEPAAPATVAATNAAEHPAGHGEGPTEAPTPDVTATPDGAPSTEAHGGVNVEVHELAPGMTGFRLGGRSTPGPSDAGAVALLAGREWMEGVGASLDGGLPRASTGAYVDHLAVEAVDFPAPGAAVATIVAVLLDVDDGEYVGARAVRAAVPVRLDAAGARPAGEPWWLPAPDLALDEPVWQEVDDPEVAAAAGEALTEAGYRDVAVRSVARTDEGWPLRAVARAVAPGEPDDTPPALRTVWLKDLRGRLVAAGWLPPTDAPEPAGGPDGARPGSSTGDRSGVPEATEPRR